MDKLVFHNSPKILIATNTFINVPVILQYEQSPLIEVIQTQEAGFTTQFQIFNSDGAYLAKVVGSRLFPTDDGLKAGLTLRYPDRMTICELAGKILFEVSRQEAAALETDAELYTPDGRFVKCSQIAPAGLYSIDRTAITVHNGIVFTGNTISNQKIGIMVRRDGSVSMGFN